MVDMTYTTVQLWRTSLSPEAMREPAGAIAHVPP
jgi:hypothetical protein